MNNLESSIINYRNEWNNGLDVILNIADDMNHRISEINKRIENIENVKKNIQSHDHQMPYVDKYPQPSAPPEMFIDSQQIPPSMLSAESYVDCINYLPTKPLYDPPQSQSQLSLIKSRIANMMKAKNE